MRTRFIVRVPVVAAAVLVFEMAATPVSAQELSTAANECASCHVSLSDSAHSTPAVLFREDLHQQRGLTCVSCHGGDPATADKARAKGPGTGYVGVPRGTAQVTVCARCHSDAEFMRQFAPTPRVDQANGFAMSAHGQKLAAGDANVATCASCHGAHGLRAVSDAKSPVFSRNVAATCGACHSNEALMGSYQLPDGSPLPTTQRADYEKSVHFEALTVRNDLSAPTCNDCHGSHGPPPGVTTTPEVCGTCHAVFATKFNASVHQPIFEKGCVDCHGSHAVLAPSTEMLSAAEPGVCAACHAGADDPGFVAAGRMRKDFDHFDAEMARTARLIDRARASGMEMSGQVLALREVQNRRVLARTEMHASTPDTVEPIVKEGLTLLESIERAGNEALDELSYRRRGLAVSLAAILLVVVALALKIRQIDRVQLEASQTKPRDH